MDETVARAELPSLDIEITHRRLPDEGAEYLAISLRAAPSFAAAARLLEAHGPMTMWPWWLALTPYAAWARMMRAAWTPWLPAGDPRLVAGGTAREEIPPAHGGVGARCRGRRNPAPC